MPKQMFAIMIMQILAVSAVPLLFLILKKNKRQSNKEKTSSCPDPQTREPVLSRPEYRPVLLDQGLLSRLNRDLKKLADHKTGSIRPMMVLLAIILLSMVLGRALHNDMVFNVGMLVGMVWFFSHIFGSLIRFHRLLRRCSRQFWGEAAPALLTQTFADWNARVTGDEREFRLTGEIHVQRKEFTAEAVFHASQYRDHTGGKDRKFYYYVSQDLTLSITPAVRPICSGAFSLKQNHVFSNESTPFPLRYLAQGVNAAGDAWDRLSGNEPETWELDPEFDKCFKVSTEQRTAAAAFLTAGQRKAILQIEKLMGPMEIHYTEEHIQVKFKGFKPVGYVYESVTGLPISFTESHLRLLLHDFETLIENLPALWKEITM